MEIHNGKACLFKSEYVPVFISEENYWKQRKRHDVETIGHGDNSLIVIDSLPRSYRNKIYAAFGDPKTHIAKQGLLRFLKEDPKARQYYADYRLPNQVELPIEYQIKYSHQADALNMITTVTEDRRLLKESLKITMMQFWDDVCALIKKGEINGNLPSTRRHLLPKLKQYQQNGYATLIVDQHRFTQDNARKVSKDIERLLLALYLDKHGRATMKDVARMYNEFMRGLRHPVDLESGELFHPDDFLVKGKLHELSDSAIHYYLNLKHNREVIDSYKLDAQGNINKHRPSQRRIGPKYALSLVSMDDYLPPFKTPDGKRAVWMYVIFDAASTAIIGVAYGTDKNKGLVDEALRDMMRTTVANGWGLPMEIEMERSLNWDRRGSEEQPDVFTEGHVFPFVRFARGGNSREKIAERFLLSFKYEELVKDLGFLGRPHGRNENTKLNRDRQENRYMVEVMIHRLRQYVKQYNEAPHPKMPGITRWQYLEQYQNPDAIKNSPSRLLPYIGLHTATSIRNEDISVKGELYRIHEYKSQVMAPGGIAEVETYWIPGEDGVTPDRIYVYQNGYFIGEADKLIRYQRARAERTDMDKEIMGQQMAYQTRYLNNVAEGRESMLHVGVINAEELQESEGVVTVRPAYDKEAQEEEEYAELQPETGHKMQKKGTKKGGYMQNESSYIHDVDSVEDLAINDI